jgi:L-alanine-DL-glutamate epimerase-like enolase superfamily enzyme
VKIADGAPVINDGYMVAPSAPGLGVTPDMAVLGKPVWVIGD